MDVPKIPTESEVADCIEVLKLMSVRAGADIVRGLAYERDKLRELVAAKDAYIACYKTGRSPSEKLLNMLDRLEALLYPRGGE